jgi:beta-mannanase
MKKNILTLLGLIAISPLIIAQVGAAQHLNALPSTVEVGVYDSTRSFANVSTMAYEHIWYEWNQSNPILPQLQSIVARGRTPLLTVNPDPVTSIGGGNSLLSDIATGRYDRMIASLANQVHALGYPVIIRFAPEMDHDAASNFAWAKRPAASYIAAYRHFVTSFRKMAPNCPILWSPVGDDGAETYYPGGDVVDYVGFSIYEVPVCSTKWDGHPMSFADWMNKKYKKFSKFGKPVIIAEVGIYGHPAEQRAWMQAAYATVGRYPLVKVLVYYNAKDPVSWARWGGPVAPDWRINPAVFNN